MLKLIGSVLLVLAFSLAGFQYAKRYRERPEQIRQLRTAITFLETEIGYGVRTLPEALAQVSLRAPVPIRDLLERCSKSLLELDGRSTYECLQFAVKQRWKWTQMQSDEKEIFLDICKNLGQSDRNTQIQHLTLAKQNLEQIEQQAQEEQRQYEKMYRTLGILAGALLIILLY
ncbi:stage III sporulation protein SpoIIIAB [Risungbinella massiliensis]|uniref:stage III sporulation protein SpoIIIAB n=1 Tax=Risungbinella massiliensis TaxID=1329796 RepID=UPI0005CB8B4C|nr:stage III sporulation protein SpoIIIAB [Risungbinella massiliensis]